MRRSALAAAVFVLLVILWFGRVQIREQVSAFFKPTLPEPIAYQEETEEQRNIEIERLENKEIEEQRNIETKEDPKLETVVDKVGLEINLAVPFTSQAPFANWDETHEETCEEAAVLMVDAFFDGRSLTKDSAEKELQELIVWEKEKFGFFEDTTAEETALILREFYGYNNVEAVYDFDENDVKAALTKHLPVIIPTYGRGLGNPNFRGKGPLYHMLVVRGITKDGFFITNDPGTRKGEEYIYESDVVLKAAHDWNGGDVQNGRRVMIIVYP